MILSTIIQEAGYGHDDLILQGISFEVGKGELVGLIGPNGAGKSTTIKTLLGLMKHVKGTVEMSSYAYIPERPIFYERMTMREHIDFLYTTMGGEHAAFEEKVKNLVSFFRLTHVLHHYPDQFSKGMQQKMMLILAFLKEPDLYIIDEPFMGLDPTAVKKLLGLLEKERERGAGVLMSTHILDTAERICDRFVLVAEGKMIVEGDLEDIRRKSGLPDGTLFDCFDALTEEGEKDGLADFFAPIQG
ncbi:ABC transporter ATP-binding protein [Rossellomorea marisflavi]|uniref:ABC transporter ATP-binding protein n=1 Tax=Rossellomorea marisflavi TaxID=189381 RepID=UPI00064FDF60|nr:ABC transporter ATP-binding protein [Rossellomorea marisflavi]KMK97220.1 ABC transporter ATP-binding protein [Rossellomorea marisflavi]TYO72557.1 ABC transporter ATP-binding protein [Rossellomorea marisflavi]